MTTEIRSRPSVAIAPPPRMFPFMPTVPEQWYPAGVSVVPPAAATVLATIPVHLEADGVFMVAGFGTYLGATNLGYINASVNVSRLGNAAAVLSSSSVNANDMQGAPLVTTYAWSYVNGELILTADASAPETETIAYKLAFNCARFLP